MTEPINRPFPKNLAAMLIAAAGLAVIVAVVLVLGTTVFDVPDAFAFFAVVSAALLASMSFTAWAAATAVAHIDRLYEAQRNELRETKKSVKHTVDRFLADWEAAGSAQANAEPYGLKVIRQEKGM